MSSPILHAHAHVQGWMRSLGTAAARCRPACKTRALAEPGPAPSGIAELGEDMRRGDKPKALRSLVVLGTLLGHPRSACTWSETFCTICRTMRLAAVPNARASLANHAAPVRIRGLCPSTRRSNLESVRGTSCSWSTPSRRRRPGVSSEPRWADCTTWRAVHDGQRPPALGEASPGEWPVMRRGFKPHTLPIMCSCQLCRSSPRHCSARKRVTLEIGSPLSQLNLPPP